ncbi:MAG TPA: hypothetical protein VHB70_09215 [Parafilimonas sp.]|nr:hypothetical protein [Parafilimonas sp.]
MNTTKFFIGGIAGGVIYFLLGYLVYGLLLANYMHSYVPGVDRSMDTFVYWALIVGNLFFGFAISYAVNRSGASIAGGLATGFAIGFLFSAGFDFTMYATTHSITLHQVAADVAAFTAVSAVAGAVIGAVCKPRTANVATT